MVRVPMPTPKGDNIFKINEYLMDPLDSKALVNSINSAH